MTLLCNCVAMEEALADLAGWWRQRKGRSLKTGSSELQEGTTPSLKTGSGNLKTYDGENTGREETVAAKCVSKLEVW